jgi:sulfide:quinone oxidoreductase
MAKILVLGGGFGGVVAAESLVNQISDEHQITLISRTRRFVLYPALVRLAFGESAADDLSFDLRQSMLSRRINFIEAEVAHLDLEQRKVIIAHGEIEGNVPYDYLIFALGRRLATERVTGFFEHSNHLLDVEGALKLAEAIGTFNGGHAVMGQCPGARLPVPAYETAFALAKSLKEKGKRQTAKITVVGPGTMASEFGDEKVPAILGPALDRNGIESLPNFPIGRVGSDAVYATDGRQLACNLLMLLPPFRGPSAASRLGITNDDGYINVEWNMKVIGVDRMYAVGDCVNFDGPKMGHMAVRQAEVAAANVASEIAGHEPASRYNHEAMMVINAADEGGIYFHKDVRSDKPGTVAHSLFWNWAKRAHEKYWESTHR